MLRSDDIAAPLPIDALESQHEVDPINTPSMSYPDAQVRLAVITQEVLSTLYMKRQVFRTWTDAHASITALTAELDELAMETMRDLPTGSHTITDYEVRQTMLKKQFHRIRILITRPALRRVERCFERGIHDYTTLDHDVAKTCISTAQEVVKLLPDEMDSKLVYEKGPWWTITHNSEFSPCALHTCNITPATDSKKVMQSLAVLLIGISCRPAFESSYADSVACSRRLVVWLQHMQRSNDTARRGYDVVCHIVRGADQVDPSMWKDIVDVFGTVPVAQPPIQTPTVYQPRGYVQEQSLRQLVRNQEAMVGNFGGQ